MRCPDCSQRNSVAAKKCAACGSSLRRKPLPFGFKISLGLIAVLIFLFSLAALSTTLVNPEKSLTNAATLLTSKSTSAGQMMNNFKRFDQSMQNFLKKYGSLSNEELTNKLATCLPKSLYEDHIFELLPNLKLVEIDTALNASNYLILLTNGKTQVMPIVGLDVYDANSFLPQTDKNGNDKGNEGQLLVLLGHTVTPHGHSPKVKVIRLSSTLQSDSIADLTDAVVPKLCGEGTAKFAPNQKDIEMSISVFGRGQDKRLFFDQQSKSSLPVDNEILYEQLIWQNGCYTSHAQPGASKLYALFAAANALKNHNKIPSFHSYFSNNARQAIEQSQTVKSDQGFTIKNYRVSKKPNNNNIYELTNDTNRAIIELRPTKNSASTTNWYVNSLSISKIIPQAATNSTNVKEVQPTRSVTAKTDAKQSTSVVAQPKEEQHTKVLSQANFVSDLKTYVKVRNGPGTNYASVADINPRTTLSIIGEENGWYKVKMDNKEGYVFAGLVNNHKNGYTSKTAKQSSTIRDDSEHIIGNIRRGDHLILLNGQSNGTYKIMLCNGKTGYVNKEVIEGGNLSNATPAPRVINKPRSARKPRQNTNTPPPSVP